jgi:thiamine biosynthesis lipoprotein
MRPDGIEHGQSPRQVSRRDLFRGRRGGDWLTAAMPAAPTSPTAPLATRALDVVEALESQLTVYNDESEVSRLNATAHLGPVEVEPGLYSLLERAVAIGRATGGVYDVAAGALSIAWGFTRGPRRVPDAATLAEALASTGSDHLILDPARKTVAFDRPGVMINLGSIGKGYAIDRAVDVIRAHWWPTTALVHGGRSSLYALGSPPDDFGGRWQVALRDPILPDRPVGTIHLRNRGMGTSGSGFQRFEANGRAYGHILDPRTGEPPLETRHASVTVLAPTAAEADALSTAFHLLGHEAAAKILADRPDVAALFVSRENDDLDSPPNVQSIHLTDADYTPWPADFTRENL